MFRSKYVRMQISPFIRGAFRTLFQHRPPGSLPSFQCGYNPELKCSYIIKEIIAAAMTSRAALPETA